MNSVSVKVTRKFLQEFFSVGNSVLNHATGNTGRIVSVSGSGIVRIEYVQAEDVVQRCYDVAPDGTRVERVEEREIIRAAGTVFESRLDMPRVSDCEFVDNKLLVSSNGRVFAAYELV